MPKWAPLRRQGWASVIAQPGVQEFHAKEFWAHMKQEQTLQFRERLGDVTFPTSREAPSCSGQIYLHTGRIAMPSRTFRIDSYHRRLQVRS